MITIYGDIYSGNCYKVKLLLNHLQIEHQWLYVDILAKQNHSESFLQLNPNGKIPLLQLDSGQTLAESNAILLYLAEDTHLLPTQKWSKAKMYQWLFFEQYSHEPFIAVARFICNYLNQAEQQAERLNELREKGYKALNVMEQQLKFTPYLAGEMYSIADISLYAYTHVAVEGGFDLSEFQQIVAWLQRVTEQNGYISMAVAAENMN